MQDVHAKGAGSMRGKCSVVAWTCAVAGLAAAAWASPGMAAAFLDLSGIPGESTNEGHAGQIDILSHDLSLVVPPTTTGTGRGAARLSCPPVTLWKNMDASSLILAKKLIQGVHIPQAVLTFQKDGAEQREFYVIKLQEVFVTEFSQSSSADATRVLEKVVLKARKYEFEYRPQSTNGGAGGSIKMAWDCVTYDVF